MEEFAKQEKAYKEALNDKRVELLEKLMKDGTPKMTLDGYIRLFREAMPITDGDTYASMKESALAAEAKRLLADHATELVKTGKGRRRRSTKRSTKRAMRKRRTTRKH